MNLRTLASTLLLAAAASMTSGCYIFYHPLSDQIDEKVSAVREMHEPSDFLVGSFAGVVQVDGKPHRDYRFPTAFRSPARELQLLVPEIGTVELERHRWTVEPGRNWNYPKDRSATAQIRERPRDGADTAGGEGEASTAIGAAATSAQPALVLMRKYGPGTVGESTSDWELLEQTARTHPHTLLLTTGYCKEWEVWFVPDPQNKPGEWLGFSVDVSTIRWEVRKHGETIPLHIMRGVLLPVEVTLLTGAVVVLVPIFALMGFPTT